MVRHRTCPHSPGADKDRPHVRGGAALRTRDGGTGRGPGPPGRRPPRREGPGVPPPAQRDRRRRARLAPRDAGAARGLHGGRARDLAHGLPRARPEARPARVPRLPRGEGRARTARGPRPAARRGDDRSRAADRVLLPPGGRARAAGGVLRLARRPRLLLDAVPPPPERAALHARARHRARGHRAREPAGRSADRRGQAARRRGRTPLHHRRGAAVHGRRLLVHDRVRGDVGGGGAALLRSGAALVVRGDRRVPRGGGAPAGLPRDGDAGVRHHALPADPLRRGRDGRAQRARRRLLRGVRRRAPPGVWRGRDAAGGSHRPPRGSRHAARRPGTPRRGALRPARRSRPCDHRAGAADFGRDDAVPDSPRPRR